MSSKNNEQYSVYTIPYNFIDESKVFGGMVSARNLIEGCILGGLASIPVFLISFPLQVKFTLILVCFLVFGVIGCIGINGDPISRFILYYLQFRKQRRMISFNGRVKFHESAADNIEFSELPRDRVLKLFAGMSSSRKEVENQQPVDIDNYIFDDDIVTEESRQDILSKLLGKKSATVYDLVYVDEDADDLLYSSTGMNAEDTIDDIVESSYELKATCCDDKESEELEQEQVDYDEEEAEELYDESIIPHFICETDVTANVYEEEIIPTIQIDTEDLIDSGIDIKKYENTMHFVDVASVMREAMQDINEWQCQFCHTVNDGRFCEECGASKETAALYRIEGVDRIDSEKTEER